MITWAHIGAVKNNWLVGRLAPEEMEAARFDADEAVTLSALPSVFAEVDSASRTRRIRKAAVAYEIAVTSALPPMYGDSVASASVDDTVARASAYLAYDLLRAVPARGAGDAAMVDNLTRCALAYMGDRGVDLQPLLEVAKGVSTGHDSWDAHVFDELYRCWVTIFGRRERIGEVGPTIARLRDEQAERERPYLSVAGTDPAEQRALRLYALYNWAKATELLAAYLRGGFDGANIDTLLDRFFGDAQRWASLAGQGMFAGLLQWLRIASARMVSLSVWNAAARSDAARRFVERLASREKPLLEFLPPQRAALLDQGVMEQSRTAVVVDMPTSSGKTLLAEFRIVQTLMAFPDTKPWVAYVVPTRALAAQIVRRLRKDLGDQYRIESLSAAVDVDSIEDQLISGDADFQVLVCTAEKLTSLARGKRIARPLRLVVVDEAHAIYDAGDRGLKLELLLATLRSESETDFMLLMPYVPNGKELAQWLSRGREPASGREPTSYADVSLSITPWKANDVLIGAFSVEGKGRNWRLEFEPKSSRRALAVRHPLTVAKASPLRDLPMSQVENSGTKAAAAMAVAFDNAERGVNLIMCPSIPYTWTAAELIRKNVTPWKHESESIALVRRFVQAEVAADFALDDLLRNGVAVHHAGLPEDVRTLVEWLIENRELRAVCATSTIAQGMDFGVGSIFLTSLATHNDDGFLETMTPRYFWNLAGRAGRVGQSHVGVVGVFKRGELSGLDAILAKTGDELGSQLESLVTALADSGLDTVLKEVRHSPDWADFRSFVSHLVAERGNDDIAAENLVRNTLGYRRLAADEKTRDRAQALIGATRQYAAEVRQNDAKLADGTGFSPEVVRQIIANLRGSGVRANDWQPDSLFSGKADSMLARLVGAMMIVPQIRKALKEFGGEGDAQKRIADVAAAWVRGDRIDEIAARYFSKKGDKAVPPREAITAACKALYRALAFAAPWGLSGLMQLPNSGLNFGNLDDAAKRELNLLPAFLYHGVASEAGVAMRLNGVPRSVAEQLGRRFKRDTGDVVRVTEARAWLAQLSAQDWDAVRPPEVAMTGSDYRTVWREILSPQPATRD